MTDEPRLCGLTTRDTRWLLDEALRVLTDLDHPASVVDGVALTLDDGRTMGLDNLARTISWLPRGQWARAVRDQLSALVDLVPDQPPATTDLRVELWARERADEFLTYDAMGPLPGVVAVLAAQGDRVLTIRCPGSHRGPGRRLRRRPDQPGRAASPPTHAAAHRPARARPVGRVPGQHGFLRCRTRRGPARPAPPSADRLPPHGVLVAVPTERELWVHVPVDENVVQTALTMSSLAYRTWAEEPYPISPDVFLVSPDMQATRLVKPDHEGCELGQAAMLHLLTALEGPPGQSRAG